MNFQLHENSFRKFINSETTQIFDYLIEADFDVACNL